MNLSLNKRYLHIFIVFTLSFAVFVNTFQNDFTYDDLPTILENEAVAKGDMSAVLQGGRAMRQLSFMIDYKLFGRNPLGYHVENAFLHAVNSVLLYEFLSMLSFGIPSALIAALVFAIHPIHVEAVAGIANRKELLSLLFIFLSSMSYIRAVGAKTESRRVWSLAGTFLFYLIAVYSKQTSALLPFLLMSYDFSFLRKEERIIGKAALPLIVIMVSYISYRFVLPAVVSFYSNPETMKISYWHILLTAVSVFYLDVRYMLFPLQLSADHTVRFVYAVGTPLFIVSLSAIAGYFAAIVISFRRSNGVFLMLMWMSLFLLPTTNLIPGLSYFFAERYLYIPSVAYSALSGRLLETVNKTLLAATVLFLILLPFSYLTVSRNTVWRNEESLWSDTIKKSSRSIFAHNNLGNVYYVKRDFEAAAGEYEAALALFPEHPESLYNLANIYYMGGDREKALQKYKLFLKVWKGDERIKMDAVIKVKNLESKR